MSVPYQNVIKETTQSLLKRYALLSTNIFLEKQNFYCVDILTAKCRTYHLLNIILYQGHRWVCLELLHKNVKFCMGWKNIAINKFQSAKLQCNVRDQGFTWIQFCLQELLIENFYQTHIKEPYQISFSFAFNVQHK